MHHLNIFVFMLHIMGSSYVNILFEFGIVNRIIRILGVSDCHHSVNNTIIDEDITKLQVLDEYRLPILKFYGGFGGETPPRTLNSNLFELNPF